LNDYDPAVQQSRDGPLTDDFRRRVLAVKARLNLNYEDIATRAGIAGSTLGNIVRYATHNTGTPTANRLAKILVELEALDLGGEDLPRPPVKLTIAEAKEGLAATFGVPPGAVEITIRA